MVNIRHELSEFLLNFGGHIGQSIRPSERGKGYGTKQLMLAIEKCAKMGIENVLVTCNIENVASAKTIEKCYGELENIVKNGDEILKRYWIDVNKIKTLTK